MNQNNSTKLKHPRKPQELNSTKDENTEGKIIEPDSVKNLNSNATTKEVYEIL